MHQEECPGVFLVELNQINRCRKGVIPFEDVFQYWMPPFHGNGRVLHMPGEDLAFGGVVDDVETDWQGVGGNV
jgi:hypothetical protein